MNTIFGIPATTLLTGLLVTIALILAVILLSAWRYPLPFRLGLRNLRRRKSQTLLIIVGLALSTVIITSALGIGDTVDYSVKQGVFDSLGAIDEQIGTARQQTAAGFGFGAAGPAGADEVVLTFDAALADDYARLVDGETIDAAAPALIQILPVYNSAANLSEAGVEIRGLGAVTGAGLAAPAALAALAEDEVLINEALALEIAAAEGDELLLVKGNPTTVRVVGVVANGELAGSTPAVIWPLAQAQRFFELPEQITDIFISNGGDVESGVELSEAAVARLATVDDTLVISTVKVDQLDTAAASAEFITTLFVTFGTFSIFSGILLIFLIFSVLAAERKSELGMGRAVGLQRADLIRQFVSEGLAYNFVAAFIGATIGVIASLLLAGTVAGLLGGGTLDITPRVSLRSIAIGYTLGLVITFFTVTISAIRISQINIIAAIRNLDLPNLPREAQWTLFVRPFTVWQAAVAKAGRGHRREALRYFIMAGPKAVLNFWSALLARGPILLLLGYWLAWVGVNVAEQSGLYGLGVSFFFVGLGQLLAWLIIPARLAYSLSGLALVLYWALPTRSVGKLAELGNSPGDFFISGLFLVGGAIALFLFNADSLLNLFAGLLGRFGRLLPVARVAIAYPVRAKNRTATTLAMFSLVVFTLVSTTTITNTFSNFLNTESGSGGYDIQVQTNPFNPISADELTMAIDELVTEGTMPAPEALAAAVVGPVEAQSADMLQPAVYLINGVDERFFASQRLELIGIAEGYEDAEAVWTAVANDSSLIIIDSFSIDRSGDPTYQPDEDAFAVTSIRADQNLFAPVPVQITGLDGVAREFTIVGTLGSAPSFFGAMMNLEAAAALGYTDAGRFFIRLPEGTDVRPVANTIESEFSRSGVQTILLKEQLEEGRQSIRSIFYLIQSFIGLGLLIGIAALGVITIRAVVERRQQIGVLRAIGFRQDMIQSIFIFEGVFVAGLGTIIGYGLALTFAYNLYLQVAADQGLDFLPPWPALTAIAVAIFGASLLMSWLPARATAKVTIAEALRYD